jgi:HEAT repeat protein
MRHLWKLGFATLLLVAVSCLAGPVRAQSLQEDPVEQLRLGLRQNRADLADLASKITSIGGLRRALMLREWRTSSLEPTTIQRYKQLWNRLADRFTTAIQEALASEDTTRRLGAADLLAEMATASQTTTGEAVPLQAKLAAFGEPLAKLTGRGADPQVRTSATRALGKVGPDPKVAAPALERVLFGTPESSTDDRRTAAAALADLIQGIAQLEKATRGEIRSARDRVRRLKRDPTAAPTEVKDAEELLKTLSDHRKGLVEGTILYLDLAGRALADADGGVRRLAMTAFQQAGIGLSELEFAAQEPDQTTEEYQKQFEEEWNTLLPLMRELRKQSDALARVINDPDVEVRTMARRATENLAYARDKLLHPSRYVTPTVLPPEGPPSMKKEESRLPAARARKEVIATAQAAPEPPKEDPLHEGLRRVLDALAKGLTDPDVRARLAAVEAIEAVGKDAVLVAPALVRALADCNVFMRWAAARTLGGIGPVEEATAVPALVRLLRDPDLDVRLAAIETLGRFGPPARDAATALAGAVTSGDVEQRIAAIAGLEGIGKDAAGVAIPALTQALGAADPRLKRAAAASLERYAEAGIDLGPDAIAALRRALNDPDADVRRFASDALLRTGPRREKKSQTDEEPRTSRPRRVRGPARPARGTFAAARAALPPTHPYNDLAAPVLFHLPRRSMGQGRTLLSLPGVAAFRAEQTDAQLLPLRRALPAGPRRRRAPEPAVSGTRRGPAERPQRAGGAARRHHHRQPDQYDTDALPARPGLSRGQLRAHRHLEGQRRFLGQL